MDSTLLISPLNATNTATLGLSTFSTTEGEAGRGELNNAASWDDFPNGRFGDFKSPAFGDQDPWGGSGISVWSFPFLQTSHILINHVEKWNSVPMGYTKAFGGLNADFSWLSTFQNNQYTVLTNTVVSRIVDDPTTSWKSDEKRVVDCWFPTSC